MADTEEVTGANVVRSVAVPDRSWTRPADTDGSVWVLVDYRETGLWEHLQRRWTGAAGVRLEQAALLVGDVEVTVAVSDGGILHVRRWIWERKTLADLSSSIADGRWSEQRRRMCSAYPPGHVHYLVEGLHGLLHLEQGPGQAKYGVSADSMRGALLRAQADEGVHVHGAGPDTHDSAAYLSAWVQSILAAPLSWARGDRVHAGTLRPAGDVLRAYGDAAARASTIGLKKGSNVTPELCFVQQLVQIPGLSAKLARTVQAKYPDLRSLVRALDAEPEPRKRRRMFEELDGIAKKRADTIVRYLGYE